MYLIYKGSRKVLYTPVRVNLNNNIGTLVITIDKKVLHVRDEEVTDVTSSYLLTTRDN